jgi:hypothetical protein
MVLSSGWTETEIRRIHSAEGPSEQGFRGFRAREGERGRHRARRSSSPLAGQVGSTPQASVPLMYTVTVVLSVKLVGAALNE